MSAFGEELGWFASLGRRTSAAAGYAKRLSAFAGSGRAGESEAKPFDLAEDMERGLVQELSAAFITPLAEGQATSHLLVERSPDMRQYSLRDQAGTAILVAQVEARYRITFHLPAVGDPPVAVGPAFVLESEDRGETWLLTADGCSPHASTCRKQAHHSRRELARISHTVEELGGGRFTAMEVELPVAESPFYRSSAHGCDGQEAVLMRSRRPRWSRRLKGLVLDFHDRCSQTSAKNFQLDLAHGGADKGEPELLFGKDGDNVFVLDYKHPLSMVQAFAIALTTKDWR